MISDNSAMTDHFPNVNTTPKPTPKPESQMEMDWKKILTKMCIDRPIETRKAFNTII